MSYRDITKTCRYLLTSEFHYEPARYHNSESLSRRPENLSQFMHITSDNSLLIWCQMFNAKCSEGVSS